MKMLNSVNIGAKRACRSRDIGIYGEKVAEYWLKSKGHEILAKNLRLKQGEIDILTFKDKAVYIIEVKAIRFTSQTGLRYGVSVREDFAPEDNLSMTKLRKLYRLREELSYFLEMGIGLNPDIIKRIWANVRNTISNSNQKGTASRLHMEQDIYISAIAVDLICARGADTSRCLKDRVLGIKVRYIPSL